MEFTGVYDAVRAAFGYDLATGEIVKSSGDRLMAGLSVTPIGKAFKYGKRGFKLFKGEEAGKKVAKVDKSTKAAKDVGKVEQGAKNSKLIKFKGDEDIRHFENTPKKSRMLWVKTI